MGHAADVFQGRASVPWGTRGRRRAPRRELESPPRRADGTTFAQRVVTMKNRLSATHRPLSSLRGRSSRVLLGAGLLLSASSCSSPGPKKVVCGETGTGIPIDACFVGSCSYARDAQSLCEYHFSEEFPDAKFDGECSAAEVQELYNMFECPPDGGGGDGGGGGDDIWVCAVNAEANCLLTEDGTCPGPGGGGDYDHAYCWTGPGEVPCVNAFSEEIAQGLCEDDCIAQSGIYTANLFPSETVCKSMVCDGTIVQPVRLSTLPGVVCEGGSGALPAWDGTGSFQAFTASAGVIFADGSTGTLSDLRGYMHYTVANCTATACDVAIDVIEATRQSGPLLVTYPSGGSTSYAVEGLDFRLLQAVTGEADMATGDVRFGTPFYGTGWAREIDAATTLTGPSVSAFAATADGTLSANGALELSLSFDIDGATVLIDFN
jgi:hypothetical protein